MPHLAQAIMDDFDGDGRLDLFTTSWGSDDRAALLLSSGNGSFVAASSSQVANSTGGVNAQQVGCHTCVLVQYTEYRQGGVDTPVRLRQPTYSS